MEIITIGVLKKVIEKLPDDFTVAYENKTTTTPISDKVEIDVSGQKLILKS